MERYECANCYHRDQLDKYGRCQRCGSDAVISLNKINIESVNDELLILFTNDELRTLFNIVVGEVPRA
jgi:hypothetical protein